MLRLYSIAIGTMLFASPALAEPPGWIANTWKLVSADQTEGGQVKQYLGQNPLGQMIFQPNGQFSIILLRSDLPKFASNARISGTPEENASTVRGSLALFGTYTLADDTLKLHIQASSFPNWINTDQTRIVHLVGNQLTYENASTSAGGGGLKMTLEPAK